MAHLIWPLKNILYESVSATVTRTRNFDLNNLTTTNKQTNKQTNKELFQPVLLSPTINLCNNLSRNFTTASSSNTLISSDTVGIYFNDKLPVYQPPQMIVTSAASPVSSYHIHVTVSYFASLANLYCFQNHMLWWREEIKPLGHFKKLARALINFSQRIDFFLLLE